MNELASAWAHFEQVDNQFQDNIRQLGGWGNIPDTLHGAVAAWIGDNIGYWIAWQALDNAETIVGVDATREFYAALPELSVNPDSIVYTENNWEGLNHAMQGYDVVEIDAEIFDYFLEVLPPVAVNTTATYGDYQRKIVFAFAEGMGEIIVFWTERANGMWRYFCQNTAVINGTLRGKLVFTQPTWRQ